MRYRPLALVSALAVGDYTLWNWSLQGSHDVPALVAGLAFPPLAIAFVWLLAVNAARLLASASRRPSATGASRDARRATPRDEGDVHTAHPTARRAEAGAHTSAPADAPSSKLAA